MATNPSIILSGTNINDVMTDQRAKLAQAQAMQTAAQMQDLQLAQAKQAAMDDKNFRQAYMEAKGDPNLTVATAARLGVSPAKIQAFQKSQSEYLTQLLTQHKTKLEGDKTQLEINDAKNSEIYGALKPALDASPDKFDAAKAFVLNDLINKGLVDKADPSLKQAANMSQDDLKMFATGLLNVKHLSDLAKGQGALQNADSSARQATVAESKLAIEKAKAVTEQNEKDKIAAANTLSNALKVGGPAAYAKALQGISPDVIKANNIPAPEDIVKMNPKQAVDLLDNMGMTANERQQLEQKKADLAQTQLRDKNTQATQLANLALRQQEVSIASKREKREESQMGMDTLDSNGISQSAKDLFDGFMDPATARMMLRKNPGLRDQASKYAQMQGVRFDEGDIDKRFNTLKEFTNKSATKPGGQLLSASTTVQHAQLFKEAVQAINNGSFVPGNAAFNKFNEVFGAAEPNNLGIVAHFLSAEAAKLATGNAPQKSEIEALSKALDRDKSPQALNAAADTLVKLGAGRLHSLKGIVDDAKLGNVVKVVDPDTAAALKSSGIDPNTFKTAALKTASLDQVKAYASHAGISNDEALAKFKSSGYQVK